MEGNPLPLRRPLILRVQNALPDSPTIQLLPIFLVPSGQNFSEVVPLLLRPLRSLSFTPDPITLEVAPIGSSITASRHQTQ